MGEAFPQQAYYIQIRRALLCLVHIIVIKKKKKKWQSFKDGKSVALHATEQDGFKVGPVFTHATERSCVAGTHATCRINSKTMLLHKRVLYALQFTTIIWLPKHDFDLYLSVTTCKVNRTRFTIVSLDSEIVLSEPITPFFFIYNNWIHVKTNVPAMCLFNLKLVLHGWRFTAGLHGYQRTRFWRYRLPTKHCGSLYLRSGVWTRDRNN